MQNEASIPMIQVSNSSWNRFITWLRNCILFFINSLKLPIMIIFFCGISSVITHLYFKQIYSSAIITAKNEQIAALNQRIDQLNDENKGLLKSNSLTLDDGALIPAGVKRVLPEVQEEKTK